jgi:hypothetical protein
VKRKISNLLIVTVCCGSTFAALALFLGGKRGPPKKNLTAKEYIAENGVRMGYGLQSDESLSCFIAERPEFRFEMRNVYELTATEKPRAKVTVQNLGKQYFEPYRKHASAPAWKRIGSKQFYYIEFIERSTTRRLGILLWKNNIALAGFWLPLKSSAKSKYEEALEGFVSRKIKE